MIMGGSYRWAKRSRWIILEREEIIHTASSWSLSDQPIRNLVLYTNKRVLKLGYHKQIQENSVTNQTIFFQNKTLLYFSGIQVIYVTG